MATRKKYIYHYFVDGKETTREEFRKQLMQHHMRCDTNYDNPLMNIGYLDTKAFERTFNSLKNRGNTLIYVSDIGYQYKKGYSFKIKKELKL